MKRIKFWYVENYHNNGGWGGSCSRSLGPFTNKNAAKKALGFVVNEQAEYWAPREDAKYEYRFEGQEDSIPHDEFIKKFKEFFKSKEHLTLKRFNLEDNMYYSSQDISLYVKEGNIDIADSFSEIDGGTQGYMENDMSYRTFENREYVKYIKKENSK